MDNSLARYATSDLLDFKNGLRLSSPDFNQSVQIMSGDVQRSSLDSDKLGYNNVNADCYVT